jgi:hypothetical protein
MKLNKQTHISQSEGNDVSKAKDMSFICQEKEEMKE